MTAPNGYDGKAELGPPAPSPLKVSPQSAPGRSELGRIPRRVIKLGGSLLDDPQLPHRWQAWYAGQAKIPTVVIVGGGPWVDAVRAADRCHQLGEVAAHWLAIDALRITARLAAQLLAVRLVTDLPTADDGSDWGDSRGWILEPSRWLRECEADCPGTKLAPSWDVTSDSIAARVAEVWGASELVLCKSCDPPVAELRPAQAISLWSQLGFVDAAFAHVCQIENVRLVNLRRD